MSYKMIKWLSSSNDKEYFMDVKTFMETRDKVRKQGFRHSCHEHILELKEVFLDSTNHDVICNGCGLFIRGIAYYTCSRSTLYCVFNLHEFCANFLSQNIVLTHLIHDEHIHKLAPIFVSKLSNPNNCNICDEIIINPGRPDPKKNEICYQCCEDSCGHFLVDLKCVASVLAVKDPDHRHALTPHLYPASFLCSICGEKNDDKESLCYICHECSFWVHDSCYPLPRRIQHPTHPHLLRMMVIDSKYREMLKCGICKENIEKKYWWYECGSCSYVIHVQCSFRKRIDKMVLPKLNEEEVKSMINLFFPDKKSVHHILTQLVRKLCKSEKEELSSDHKLKLHHSHQNCRLVICETKEDNDQVCDACVLPISEPPFYTCIRDSCKFFLHKWCANLPKVWKFNYHDPQHTFFLVKKIDGFGFRRCKICDKVGNGFFFQCRVCGDYYIDIKCASLPDFVMHDSHDHPLLLLNTSQNHETFCATCYCCVGDIKSKYVYGCVYCHVFLHVKCSWAPKKLEHWYDEHPFCLVYNWPVVISGDGSDDYFCEFCEITIEENYWFYHCSECEQSTHISCLCRDFYPTLKFGKLYYLSNIHQHPLKCVMVPSKDLHQYMVNSCRFCVYGDRQRVDWILEGWEEMMLQCLICEILLHAGCVDLRRKWIK